MTSNGAPVLVGPTRVRWTTSRLKSAGVNLLAPPSRSSPSVLCAPEIPGASTIASPSPASNPLNDRMVPPLSPDQLVGQGEDSRRDRDTVRLGRAEIEDQVELGRTLDRQLARLGPFQQLID